MAIIKCKMCGGDIELSADKSFGTCEYCGSTMTLPKVDDDQRAAAFNRGNHFRRIGEFDKALAVYERIVQEDEGDAEAHWCCALCRFGIEYVKDPASGEYMPTCHRASFDSFLEDVDYRAALQHADAVARSQYEAEGEKIAEVQRGILSISQKEQPFDVFICYKESDDQGRRTVDSTLAQDIYYQLTEQGRRVFFARITLEEKAGQEYEPYIFAALHSAKVMVVVGTKPEYLNAVWVKNEWSRYLALMKKDRKRLLLPCYRDMDPYDLPEQLSVLQAYDMGKIGFIQDLTRGIAKVLDADKKPAAPDTPAAQGGGANVTALLKRGSMALEDGEWNSADSYFDRVLDIDAECAEAYWGKVLVVCKCTSTQSYIAKEKVLPEDKLEKKEACPADQERIDKAVETYQAPPFLEGQDIRKTLESVNRTYDSAAPFRKGVLEAKERLLSPEIQERMVARQRLFARACQYARGDLAAELADVRDQILSFYREWVAEAERQDQENCRQTLKAYAAGMDEKERQIQHEFQNARKTQEERYAKACEGMANQRQATYTTAEQMYVAAEAYRSLAEMFRAIGPYLDSEEQAKACSREAMQLEQMGNAEEKRLKREAEKRAEQQQLQAEKKAEQQRQLQAKQQAIQKKRMRIITAVVAAVLVLAAAGGLLYVNVIRPSSDYSEAESLLEAGAYGEAAAAFYELGDYQDSAARGREAYLKLAEADLDAGDRIGAAISFLRAGKPLDARETYDFSQMLMAGSGTSLGRSADGNLYFQTDAGKSDHYCSEEMIAQMGHILDFQMGLDADGRLLTALNSPFAYSDIEKTVMSWSGIVDLIDNVQYVVCLMEDGTVRMAAHAGEDIISDCSGWTNIVQIADGGSLPGFFGIDADGKVYHSITSGSTACDTSGLPPIRKVVPFYGDYALALAGDGTVCVLTNGDSPADVQELQGKTGVADILKCQNWAVFLNDDGTVEVWGTEKDRTNYSEEYDPLAKELSGWENIAVIYDVCSGVAGVKRNGNVKFQSVNNSDQSVEQTLESWSNIVYITSHVESYTSRSTIMHALGLKDDGTVVSLKDHRYYYKTTGADYSVDYEYRSDGTFDEVDDWKLW